ncbi:MAG: glycosyltransferase, partial [Candidatus Aenigmatarchaeota archaeon]
MKISVIGTLPPLKGISPYCAAFAKELSKNIYVEFINFKSIYPEFLYPGKSTKVKDPNYLPPKLEKGKIKNVLTWYNPFSWIKTGLTLEGDIVHAQWWSYVLAPVYLTILLLAKLRGKKIVITVHNVFPHESNWFSNLLNKSVIHLGDRFIVHSEDNKKTFIDNFKINDDKV